MSAFFATLNSFLELELQLKFVLQSKFRLNDVFMKLKTKAWLVSQGMLIVTAIIIQLTFYKEIKVGPMLGMPKRDYWDIINKVEPEIPQYVIENNLIPKMYDARLDLSLDDIKKANLGAYRKAHRQESGLRMAFKGGLIVNFIYLLAYQILVRYFEKTIARAKVGRS